MKKLILIIILTGCGYKSKNNLPKEVIKKVVQDKTRNTDNFILGFTDASSVNVSFGIYSLAEKGDTVCFECIEGKSFSVYNCLYDTTIKVHYGI